MNLTLSYIIPFIILNPGDDNLFLVLNEAKISCAKYGSSSLRSELDTLLSARSSINQNIPYGHMLS